MYDNQVRALIAKVEAHLAQLSRVVAAGQLTATTVVDLRATWEQLIAMLDVARAPTSAAAPLQPMVMRLATRAASAGTCCAVGPQLSDR